LQAHARKNVRMQPSWSARQNVKNVFVDFWSAQRYQVTQHLFGTRLGDASFMKAGHFLYDSYTFVWRPVFNANEKKLQNHFI